MCKRLIYVFIAFSMFVLQGNAAKERVIRFQNHVRFGYDDNVYSSESGDETDTAFLTDIVNLSAKLNFSSRTDALLYWQPEFRYRFDADPEFATYQDFYAKLNHALSQRTFLTISDRFRYQDKDGQTSGGGSAFTTNPNYFENDLLGTLDVTLNSLSYLKLGGGYRMRSWDESSYGAGGSTGGNNDYDQFSVNGSYLRQLRPNTTQGSVGVNYTDHEFNGSRGGYQSTALYVGVDQNFNPNVTGNAQAGLSMASLDGAQGDDSTSPYVQAGLEVNPTARTSVNGSLGFSQYRAENSFYNMQDRFNLGFGVRHDITAKISVASSVAYTHSVYDSDYALEGSGIKKDAKDDYVRFSLRGSYQINRNNFVEAGYEFQTRWTDTAALREYDRNRLDIGWRLRL